MNEIIQAPRIAEIYDPGGGPGKSISGASLLIFEISGDETEYEYVDENRKGDHICYITDLTKMKNPADPKAIKLDGGIAPI